MGNVISEYLRERKLSQEWLAEQVGVSIVAVSKWTRTGKISRPNAIKVAEILHISVDELYGRNKDGVGQAPVTTQALTLTYVDPEEMQLLTWYREANDMGKELIKAACEHAPKKKLASGSASAGELK